MSSRHTDASSNDSDATARLHRDSFVFDFVPMEPMVATDRSRSVMFDGLTKGLSAGQTIGKMHFDRLRELEESVEARDLVDSDWRTSGVNAIQVTLGSHNLAHSTWDGWIQGLGYWHRRVRAMDQMALCLSADDLERAWRVGKVGILLGVQDGGPIGDDLWKLEALYGLGLRVFQLTYNDRNVMGSGCTDPEQIGLTGIGRQVVELCNQLGVIVDTGHTGYASTLDAIAVSCAPVAVTHSCCERLYAHPRAKTDDQLRALADANGYIGIVSVPFFLAQKGANLDTMIDHIVHAASIMGVERVGIATDWGGWTPDLPEEIQELSRQEFLKLGFDDNSLPEFGVSLPELTAWRLWPSITKRLVQRGFTEDEVRGLIGVNWLGFMRRVTPSQ
jgi:membrane dipeptidase